MTYRPVFVDDHLYFITGSIVGWLPIFRYPEYRDIILDSWKWHRKRRRWKLFAFVIMTDHIHWISLPQRPFKISQNIWSFSSYTAHAILSTARTRQHLDFLRVFSRQAQIGKEHQIWQRYQAKNIYTSRFLIQKMEYIHNNPLRKYPARYAKRSDYPFSSACYYDDGVDPIIEIDDVSLYIENL